MGRQQESPATSLKKSWQRWTTIVELFARRRRNRHDVSGQEYRDVHKAILEASDALAATTEGEQRRFLFDLLELAHPWVTLKSLDRADCEVVAGLLVECQEVRRQLEGRSRLGERLRALGPLFLMVVVLAGVVAWLWPTIQEKGAWRLLDDVEGYFYQARYALMQTTFGERLFAAAAAITLGTVCLVWRSTRRY